MMPNLGTLLALLLVALTSSGHAAPAARTNEYCPVMPEEYAHEEFFLNYRGVEVRFCCDRCIRKFRKNPAAYLDLVPQLQQAPAPGWLENVEIPAGVRTGLLVAALACLSLLFLRARSARHRIRPADEALPAAGQWRARTLTLNLLAVVGAAGLLYWLVWRPLGPLLFERDLGLVELAAHFGRPPLPPKLEVGTPLGGTYYRGNDERKSTLFNNGHYRTATFELVLEDAQGAGVSAGQSIRDRSLFVRLELDRPPHAARHYYTAEGMSKIFLSSSFDTLLRCRNPTQDSIPLTPTVKNEHWQARYELGTLRGSGEEELSGMIYLYRGVEMEGAYRPTIYYGIRYELRSKDGVLLPDSELWMGSLYSSPAVSSGVIPLTQWFSLEPVPIIPDEWMDELGTEPNPDDTPPDDTLPPGEAAPR